MNGWDSFDSPDIKFILTGDDETYESEVINNVDVLPVRWQLPQGLQASSFRWRIQVIDIDNIGYDEILNLTFNPFLRWDRLDDCQAKELIFYSGQWKITILVNYIE